MLFKRVLVYELYRNYLMDIIRHINHMWMLQIDFGFTCRQSRLEPLIVVFKIDHADDGGFESRWILGWKFVLDFPRRVEHLRARYMIHKCKVDHLLYTYNSRDLLSCMSIYLSIILSWLLASKVAFRKQKTELVCKLKTDSIPVGDRYNIRHKAREEDK